MRRFVTLIAALALATVAVPSAFAAGGTVAIDEPLPPPPPPPPPPEL